jgi:hypothetical protein
MTKYVSAAEIRGNRIAPRVSGSLRKTVLALGLRPKGRDRPTNSAQPIANEVDKAGPTRTASRRQVLTLQVRGSVEDAANELLAAAWRGDFTPTRWKIPSDLWLQVLCADDASRVIGLAELPIDTRTYRGLPVDVAPAGSGALALEAVEAIPL